MNVRLSGAKIRFTQSTLERNAVWSPTRGIAIWKKNLCLFKQTPIPAKVTFYIIPRAFESCLACPQVISDWLGKLKPNKLSTGCQNEFEGGGSWKGHESGQTFILFFYRLRRQFALALRAFLCLCRSVVLPTKPPMLRRLVIFDSKSP